MKNNNPILRFHEFNENWVLKSIEELAKEFFGGGTPKTTISEFWNGEIPWLQSSDLTNHKVYGVTSKKNINSSAIKNSATKIIPKDSIAIVTRVGVGKIALLEHPYSTSQDFLSLSGLNIDKWFGVYLLYNKLQKELKQVQGTSIKGITKSELLRKNVSIPEINEQKKIGSFFKNLDDTISLHQHELEALKQTKQGFLQKMFPKDGETVPEVRLKNFVESWREVSLGAISDSYSGGTPSAGNKKYYNGTIPFIRSAEINSSTTELFLTEEGLNNSSAKLVKKGTILYAMYGATSGEVGISRIDGAINQAILAIKPKEEYAIQFLYQYLKKSKKSIVNSYLQGGQGNLSGAIIKKISIWLPESREEQVEIGEFFRQLDEVIELKEKEIEALKETKKGFLQKMFV